MLELEQVHTYYGNSYVLQGISLQVKDSSVVALLGRNGMGKTTTIRILSTVLEPDVGEVTIGGFSTRQQPEKVRSIIGVCPQELALYEELTALDNLTFFGRLVGLNGKETRAQSMSNLALMELEQRAKGKVSKFSGGMKRRVNLAIALMGHPKLLFLDEPTVGIDPQSRNKIFETIQNLRQNGLTVLYTTHYMEEADRLCDRVAIMDGGKIIAIDTPRALKTQLGDPDKTTLEDVFLKLTGRSLRD